MTSKCREVKSGLGQKNNRQLVVEGMGSANPVVITSTVLDVRFEILTVLKSPVNGRNGINSRKISNLQGAQLMMCVCMYCISVDVHVHT